MHPYDHKRDCYHAETQFSPASPPGVHGGSGCRERRVAPAAFPPELDEGRTDALPDRGRCRLLPCTPAI